MTLDFERTPWNKESSHRLVLALALNEKSWPWLTPDALFLRLTMHHSINSHHHDHSLCANSFCCKAVA